MSKLSDSSTDTGQGAPRDEFPSKAGLLLKHRWPADGGVEEKWKTVKTALIEAADQCLGPETKRQPDWFADSLSRLEPLFQKRNALYSKWLSSWLERDRKRFAKARSDARRVVRVSKNAWFQAKAEEAQRNRFSGKKAWKCIRDMQRGHRGLVTTRCVTIKDESGSQCTTTQAQHQMWRRHFMKVLNVQSEFDMSVMDGTQQRQIKRDLEELPSE